MKTNFPTKYFFKSLKLLYATYGRYSGRISESWYWSSEVIADSRFEHYCIACIQLQHVKNITIRFREEYPTLAPHEMESKEVEVSNHPVVTRARKGDVLRVMRNVGGGGGHKLTVRDFTMRIAHKSAI